MSERHRLWGWNCPAVDVDFLMVEYNRGKPCALIEYKRYTAAEVNPLHPSYQAIRLIADAANIPFAVSFCWPEIWAFQVVPINERAHEFFEIGELFSELEYVVRLYEMRDEIILTADREKLNDVRPDTPRIKVRKGAA